MKKGAVAVSMAIGAGLMYLIDPQQGRRRRALVRDKMTRAANKTGSALQGTARDLSNRARGTVAEIRSRLQAEPVPDDVLAERVRARLGRVVSNPSAVEVAARAGRVTLSGPVLMREAKGLVGAVTRVRGVDTIENRLDVHRRPDNVPALQGAATSAPAQPLPRQP